MMTMIVLEPVEIIQWRCVVMFFSSGAEPIPGTICAQHQPHQEVYRDINRQTVHRTNEKLNRRI